MLLDAASLPHSVGHAQSIKELDLFGPRRLLCTICSAVCQFLHLILAQQSSYRHQAVGVLDTLARQAYPRQRLIRPVASPSIAGSALGSPQAHCPATCRRLAFFLQQVSKQNNLSSHTRQLGEKSSAIYPSSREDKRFLTFNCSTNKTRKAQRASAPARGAVQVPRTSKVEDTRTSG